MFSQILCKKVDSIFMNVIDWNNNIYYVKYIFLPFRWGWGFLSISAILKICDDAYVIPGGFFKPILWESSYEIRLFGFCYYSVL